MTATKPLPDRQTLSTLDMTLSVLEGQRSDIAAGIRDHLKDAKDGKGLHPEAYRLARKLKGQAVPKRAAFLRAFLHYIEELGLDDQADLLEPTQITAGKHLKAVG
jgi:hypothetical protein